MCHQDALNSNSSSAPIEARVHNTDISNGTPVVQEEGTAQSAWLKSVQRTPSTEQPSLREVTPVSVTQSCPDTQSRKRKIASTPTSSSSTSTSRTRPGEELEFVSSCNEMKLSC